MLPVVILSVAGSGQLVWNLPANKLVVIPDSADSSALSGVPVWSVDQAFVDSIKASA